MPVDLPGELTALRRVIMTMGACVQQRVNRAITALMEGKLDLAQEVIDGDDEIDQMEVEIEQAGMRILALSQPVATDLRLVLVSMRVSNTLERIGDLARGVAKRAITLHDPERQVLPTPLANMAAASQSMLSDVMQALADREPNLARSVRGADQRVDDLQREIFTWAQTEIPRHVDQTTAAIGVLTVARKLERIADLSTNIAEDIIFLVEGVVVRHRTPDQQHARNLIQ